MPVPLLAPEKHWECPNCTIKAITKKPNAPIPFHVCKGLRGLNAPMVQEGVKAKVEVQVREDYVGKEEVQYDGEGTPIMSVVTTRDEGQDCAVYAPVAQGNAKEFR